MKRIIYDFNKIKKRMMEKKYTQEKLANILNVTKQSINNKLNNRRPFTPYEISSIAEILGICGSIEEYFFSKDSLENINCNLISEGKHEHRGKIRKDNK